MTSNVRRATESCVSAIKFYFANQGIIQLVICSMIAVHMSVYRPGYLSPQTKPLIHRATMILREDRKAP